MLLRFVPSPRKRTPVGPKSLGAPWDGTCCATIASATRAARALDHAQRALRRDLSDNCRIALARLLERLQQAGSDIGAGAEKQTTRCLRIAQRALHRLR